MSQTTALLGNGKTITKYIMKGDRNLASLQKGGKYYSMIASPLLSKIDSAGVRSMIINGDGTISSYGSTSNTYGQLDVPVGLDDAIHIAGENHHALALKLDGTLVGWGINRYGQMDIPVGLDNVVHVDTDGGLSIAVKSDGTIVVWGTPWAERGGETNDPVSGVDIVQVSISGSHTLLLKSNGVVEGVGYTRDGAAVIPEGLIATSIHATDHASFALRVDGTVVGWGTESYGYVHPVGITDIIQCAHGKYHGVALKDDGTVVTWGTSAYGLNVVPAGLTDVVQVFAGKDNSFALRSNGELVSWGDSNPITNIPIAI